MLGAGMSATNADAACHVGGRHAIAN